MYDPDAHNSLPSLGAAANLVNETVRAQLFGPIRQFFRDQAAYKKYGVALLHKHFHINDTERLVECRHSSAAWKVGQEADVVPQYQGLVVPRSFRLYKGVAVPYEFAYVTEAPLHDDTFQTEALKMLEGLGLDHIFGLRCLDEHDSSLSIEITEGKTNIMIRRGSVPDSELIEALWIFGDDENDRCHCREHCWPTKDSHDKDHSCG